jgi:predicted metal-dependent HD superfamily phosphohydrolase
MYPVPLSGDDRLALYLAVWLHDVIYDTDNEVGVPANEYRSAQYAMVLPSCLGPSWEVKNEAARLIVSTLDHLAAPQDLLVATLLDADLSILGSAPDAYRNYVAAVRKEYASASDEQWAQGRSAVMLAFLSRPYIYFDPVVRANLEIRARKNITGELKELAN